MCYNFRYLRGIDCFLDVFLLPLISFIGISLNLWCILVFRKTRYIILSFIPYHPRHVDLIHSYLLLLFFLFVIFFNYHFQFSSYFYQLSSTSSNSIRYIFFPSLSLPLSLPPPSFYFPVFRTLGSCHSSSSFHWDLMDWPSDIYFNWSSFSSPSSFQLCINLDNIIHINWKTSG